MKEIGVACKIWNWDLWNNAGCKGATFGSGSPYPPECYLARRPEYASVVGA